MNDCSLVTVAHYCGLAVLGDYSADNSTAMLTVGLSALDWVSVDWEDRRLYPPDNVVCVVCTVFLMVYCCAVVSLSFIRLCMCVYSICALTLQWLCFGVCFELLVCSLCVLLCAQLPLCIVGSIWCMWVSIVVLVRRACVLLCSIAFRLYVCSVSVVGLVWVICSLLCGWCECEMSDEPNSMMCACVWFFLCSFCEFKCN